MKLIFGQVLLDPFFVSICVSLETVMKNMWSPKSSWLLFILNALDGNQHRSNEINLISFQWKCDRGFNFEQVCLPKWFYFQFWLNLLIFPCHQAYALLVQRIRTQTCRDNLKVSCLLIIIWSQLIYTTIHRQL